MGSTALTPRRVAVVHDYLNQYGGAERVVEAMHRAFPAAPIHTTIYDRARMPESFRAMDVRASFLQRAPGIFDHFRRYLPLYPAAIRSLQIEPCDVVVSSSSAFAMGARIPAGARHLSYCYNPMRFAWDTERYLERETMGPLARAALSPFLAYLRRWDLANAKRVDRFLTSCRNVAERIRRTYGREAEIVYPPVDVSRWKSLAAAPESGAALDAAIGGGGFTTRGFFLVVSRLRAYKRVDLAVDACAAAGLPLLVIGDGEERASLQSRAGRTVRFLGRQSDAVVAAAYARCAGLVFPGEEDFGLTPVEAMACGAPVVAFAAGGALETLTGPVVSPDGSATPLPRGARPTGLFFSSQTVASLGAALHAMRKTRFRPADGIQSALRFDEPVFVQKLSIEAATLR